MRLLRIPEFFAKVRNPMLNSITKLHLFSYWGNYEKDL